jgi:transcriptional regulator
MCFVHIFALMYIPKYFQQEDLQQAAILVRQNEFAILTTSLANTLQAVHIPFILKEEESEWILYAHFAAANPLVGALRKNEEALVIFQGAHAYVSSSWYKHVSVPTWNYSAVHCYGKLERLNKEETIFLLQQTMNHYEGMQENGMKWETLPEKLKENLMKEMVAFKIVVTRIEAKVKLSQNKSEEDFHSVMSHLQQGDAQAKAVADEMQKVNRK